MSGQTVRSRLLWLLLGMAVCIDAIVRGRTVWAVVMVLVVAIQGASLGIVTTERREVNR